MLASNHAFHHARTKALTCRLLDHRTAFLDPSEDKPAICRKRPFYRNTAFGHRQSPILGRVGGQFVQSHRHCLSGIGL